MRTPAGEVTMFEDMGDGLAAAFFMFIALVVAVIVAVVWAIRNFKRRPLWTGKVLLVTLAAPLLLVTPLVWKNQADSRASYPARYQEYERELADYRRSCASEGYSYCFFEPHPPEHPIVSVPLYILMLGLGAASLVGGLRIKATDR